MTDKETNNPVAPSAMSRNIEVYNEENPSVEIRVYRRRWIVVLALSLLIFSNSMSRLAFSPVSYTSAIFYESEVSVINWFAIVYMAVGIPFGFATTWIMERFGLRLSLISASWLNVVGCVVRASSTINLLPSFGKLFLVFTGHVFSSVAQPFFMFAPTKVAAVWFPENQRALANTLATAFNPLGILAANVFSPLIVRSPEDVSTMLIIYAIPACVGALIASCGIRSDAPPKPPSISAMISQEPFWKGVKNLIANKYYWVLVLSIGGGIGIFTVLTVFLEQILCPRGYSDIFIGVVCGSCLVISGVIGALIAGKIADITKQFASVAKSAYVLCIGALGAFTFLQIHQNFEVVIAICCGLIGFFSLPLLPLGNELVVETTYPTDPSTSTGLLFLAGQLQGMFLIVVLQGVAQPINSTINNSSSCSRDNQQSVNGENVVATAIQDMTIPCYVSFGYACFICLCFVLLFRNSNLRNTVEIQQKELQKKLNN